MEKKNFTKRDYRVTVILDTREQSESADDMGERLKGLLESVGAAVSKAEGLGIKEFARTRNRNFREGSYATFSISAPASFAVELLGRLRLDKTVNRTLIERI
jgi:ribosomal protein S6